MTKDVLVSIKGMQVLAAQEEDEVEVITSGNYLQKDGTHYIRYEEVIEGMEGTIRNLIKLNGQSMEVTRKGITNTHMIFEKNKKNETYYNTPFGSLLVGISATSIDVKDESEQIDVTVQYALDVNYEHMADCTINMNIRPKENGAFRLS